MLFTVDKYYNSVNMINIYLQCSHDKAVNNGEQVKRREQKYCNLTIFIHYFVVDKQSTLINIIYCG